MCLRFIVCLVGVGFLALASPEHVAEASPLQWAPRGAPNARPMGVETNGTVTFSCRADVQGILLLGRAWAGSDCVIGSGGKSYGRAKYEVLVGDGGSFVQTHDGGFFRGTLLGGGFGSHTDEFAPCVALRGSGERIPGYVHANPRNAQEGTCSYQWDKGNGFESRYLLLVEANSNMQPPTEIKDWQLTNTGIELVVQLDPLRYRVAQELPKLARGAAPKGMGNFEWLTTRYLNLQIDIDGVDITSAIAPNEMTLGLRGGIGASRETRVVSIDRGIQWVPDGEQRVVGLTGTGRLRVTADTTDVVVTYLGDSIRGETLVVLPGFAATADLKGARVGETRITLGTLFPNSLFEGVRVTALRISNVNALTATLDIDLEVQ